MGSLNKIISAILLLFAAAYSQYLFSQTISECTSRNDVDRDNDGLIELCDIEDLNAIRYQLDGSGYRAHASATKVTAGCAAGGCKGYELVRDLDFGEDASYSSTQNKVVWTQGAGWHPIGVYSGVFEGNGHTISGLFIDRAIDNVGLFARTASGSRLSRVHLSDVDVRGSFGVGALVGYSEGAISDSGIVGGRVFGEGDDVGGMVGVNEGALVESHARLRCSDGLQSCGVRGADRVGGLVGANVGAVINSYAEVNVVGNEYVGGLAGHNESETFANNYAIGRVEGKRIVGGLVGENRSVISGSYATANVRGAGNNIGGLVGVNNHLIIDSHGLGDVFGLGDNVGGLAGVNRGRSLVVNSYGSGDVNGEGDSVGGLVGINDGGEVRNSYATGDVRSSGAGVGGLAGFSRDSSLVVNSYATGDVGGVAQVGGLVGHNATTATVQYSYAIGSVSGLSNVGGLIGLNEDGNHAIVNSHWDAEASAIVRSDGGVPKITAQLQLPTSAGSEASEVYHRWSDDDWDFGSRNQYPALKYATGSGDIAACGSALIPVSCEGLLSGQHTVLSALLMPQGLSLFPAFNSEIFNYEVFVGRGAGQLNLIPLLRDRTAQLQVISDRGFDMQVEHGIGVLVPLHADADVTLIQLGRGYRINVRQGIAAPAIKVSVSDHRINEGDTLTMDASPRDTRGSETLDYEWTQVSGRFLLSEAATDQPLLEIAIPEDFVGKAAEESELRFQVEVRHGRQRVRQQIALTVVKVNNDVGKVGLSMPGFSEATLTLVSPAVDDLIQQDADGSGNRVAYQWQHKPAGSMAWMNIEGAIEKTYNIPLNADFADFVFYRVRAAYRDGQGYRQEVVSNAYIFIKDIDKDDDRLIDIDYLEDLDAMRYQLDGSGYRSTASSVKQVGGCPTDSCRGYELTRDLDFEDEASYRDAALSKSRWTAGSGWEPIGMIPKGSCTLPESRCFSSVLEGNGYKIVNLRINRPSANGVGLFGFASGARISNVGLVNAAIIGGNQSGALLGQHNDAQANSSAGEIENSYVVGYVEGRRDVGGLVGFNDRELIVNSYMIGRVSGRSNVGGLVGYNERSRISRNYAEGIVVGKGSNAGGLIGNNDNRGEISNSYAVGHVSGGSNVGGLVGYNGNSGEIGNSYAVVGVVGSGGIGGLVGSGSGTIRHSYWDTQVSGITTGMSGLGRTTAQLQSPTAANAINPATYTDWSSNDWDFGSETHYPILKTANDNLLLPASRNGLKDLVLSDHARWSPIFKPSADHYIGTIINDSEVIRLSPIAIDPAARISIYKDGELIGSDTTSHTIVLSSDRVLHLGIEVASSASSATVQYTLELSYRYRDIDEDDDGLIEISSLEQLDAMRYRLDGSGYRAYEGAEQITTGCPIVDDKEICKGYELTSDLDFNELPEDSGLRNWQPIGSEAAPFIGIFKANGYEISNLRIDRGQRDNVGLFGVADGILDHIALSAVDIKGRNVVGSVIGLNLGTITNSYTRGRIAGIGEGLQVGGFAGSNDGEITACYTSSRVEGGNYAGGFVGRNSGEISNSYASGNVKSRDHSGGFVGWNDTGQIENSYAVGEVSGLQTQGGFAARDSLADNTSTTISYSYWDTQTTGQGDSAGGINFKTMTLKTAFSQSTNTSVAYYQWDEGLWQFKAGRYPTLKRLSGQNLGLADLRLNSPQGITLSPTFRRLTLHYRTTVYAGTASIRLTPTALSTATIAITSDAGSGNYSLGNAIMSDLIPLNAAGETRITIDVATQEDESEQYQIIVNRLRAMRQASDIDRDDDGLIEIDYLEDLDAMRYQLDGSGYKESERGSKITYGCPEAGCIGYELTGDLDFNESSNYRDAANRVVWTTHAGWQPIGLKLAPFTARFIGNGRTISNLRIIRADEDAVALFGALRGTRAEIKGIGLHHVNITGARGVGAIVGVNEGGTIANSYVLMGKVEGHTAVGGLVGSLAADASITHSYADVQVLGTKRGGSLVGEVSSATITYSYAAGKVSGDTDIGGLVGYTDNGNYTSNYWDTQTSGQDGTAIGSASGFTTEELQSPRAPGSVGQAYDGWDAEIWDFGTAKHYPALKDEADESTTDQRIGLAHLELMLLGLDGLDKGALSPAFQRDIFDYQLKVYADLQKIQLIPSAYYDASVIRIRSDAGDETFERTVKSGESSGNIPQRQSGRTIITIDVETGDRSVNYRIALSYLARDEIPNDIDIDDDGLIELYFLEDLDAMRYQLDGSSYKENKTAPKITRGCAEGGCKGFELVRDLDFNDTTSYRQSSNQADWTQGEGWLPIGARNNPFSGWFKGNGHTISNLMIDKSESNDVGLFGRTSDVARIDSIALLDITVSGYEHVGGLVGRNSAKIANSHTTGNVLGDESVGGLIGRLEGRGTTVVNSYARTQVTGRNYAGGFIGFADSQEGIITNCYATGDVAAIRFGGGFIGYTNRAIATNNYATGNVAGTNSIGGFIGFYFLNSTRENVRNNYALGSVIATTNRFGGFVGSGGNRIEDRSFNYWNSDIVSAANNQYRYRGFATDALQSTEAQRDDISKAYYRWDTAAWNFGTNTQYPALNHVKGPDPEHNPACRDASDTMSRLPLCGTLLSSQRVGLANLGINLSGLTFSPDFQSIVADYRLTVYRDTENIRLTPTAYNSSATVLIRSSEGFSEAIAGSGESNAIPLNRSGETMITIDVRSPNGEALQYRIGIDHLVFDVVDLDTDNDALIEIDAIEKLDAMRYQLDGSGYRESETGSKITLGCPEDGCRGYELMTDLDFGNKESYLREENQPVFTRGRGWQPIGDSLRPFTSVFNGNGKVISDLMINRPEAEGVALFGETLVRAEIKNIGLFNVDVIGKSAVGGLVGVNRSIISKSYTTGKVEAKVDETGNGGNKAGGLVGVNIKEDIGVVISNSYADTWVIARDRVGGLVGDGTGIVSGEIILNSYAIGRVDGSTNVGGILGNNRIFRVANSYWDTDTSGTHGSAGGTGLATEALQMLNFAERAGWSNTDWDFGTANQYPALKDDNDNLFSRQRLGLTRLEPRPAKALLFPDFRRNLFNYGMTVYADSTNIHLFRTAYDESSTIRIGSDAREGDFAGSADMSAPIPLQERGETEVTIDVTTSTGTVRYRIRVDRFSRFTENQDIDIDKNDNALIEIESAEQLNAMRYRLDGSSYRESDVGVGVSSGCDEDGNDGNVCKGYELVKDLDLEGIDFAPIGSAENPFSGTFEANGYRISKLAIDASNADNVALFAHITATARINAVELLNAEIRGRFRVGALVAVNKGTISNSYVTGTIEGDSTVGGLVGFNENLIINSHASGHVNGRSLVGGLAARNENGASINHSYALNHVSGHDRIGALVGLNSGAIANAYASGSARGSRVIGGLIGEHQGMLSNSYATALVVGVRHAGGLMGVNLGRVSHSYWDKEAGHIRSAGGLSFNSRQLKASSTQNADRQLLYYEWRSEDWDFGTAQTYPILKYTSGSDVANPACGNAERLPNCGTSQRYGLVSLSTIEPTMLSPEFDPSKLNYQVKVNTAEERIHLVASALNTTSIVIVGNNGFNQRVPSGTTSSAIILNPAGATVVTIDVAGDRAVQYHLEVIRLPLIAAAEDIDDDDDGLIEIHTLEDLNAVRYQLDGSGYQSAIEAEKITTGCSIGGCRGYELIGDLNFNDAESYRDAAENKEVWALGVDWEPIGTQSEPLQSIFEGNGYHIANLTITRPDSNYVALFGYVSASATIDNIGLLNVNITGANYVGGLAGVNEAEIKSAYVIGNVRGNGSYIGGLLGVNEGTITNSYANVDADGLLSNSNNIGGLAGKNDGTVSNSYAMGSVTGYDKVGGLVGSHAVGEIIHSYAIGDVSGQSAAGGLVGASSATITYSYWNAGKLLNEDSHGIGLAANALRVPQRTGTTPTHAYFQWGETIWDFGTSEQYPALKYANGTLLPMQRNGLIDLALSEGARLLPAFKPSILNYDVLVDAGTSHLQLTPMLGDNNTILSIYVDGMLAANLMSTKTLVITLNDAATTEIVVAVRTPHTRMIMYKLIVNRLADVVIEGVPSGVVDEGTRIKLDGTYRVGRVNYRYNWKQLSTHALPSGLDMTQAILEFEVPQNLVASASPNSEIRLRLEVSADDELLASKAITLTINKINNGFIQSIAAPTLNLSELTVPRIDLSADPDGAISNVAYQWQQLLPSRGADWLNLEGATEDTYTIPPTVIDGSQYRMSIDYVDGQSYINKNINSKAFLVIDIDKDGDGLIEIDNLEDLNAMRYQTNGSGYRENSRAIKLNIGCPARGCKGYELIRDLDFNDAASYRDATNRDTWTTGLGWLPINNFNSIFKGNGYAISNLYMDRNTRNVALFSTTKDNAVIDDISLLEVNILASTSFVNAGGLVGNNEGVIMNSYVTGNVSRGRFIGGIVGNNKGTIRNSHAACNVSGSLIGGLVGSNDNLIINSYATGSVSEGSGSGGLVGENVGSIINSYATGSVSGRNGGLVGFGSGSVMNSYWDKQTSTVENSAGGLGFESAMLKSALAQREDDESPYYTWDDNDWDFGSDEQYPALKYACDVKTLSEPSKCATLLPNQGASALLAQLILSKGASLDPAFDPRVFRYRVQVDDFENAIAITPYVSNINTKIKVSKNGETVVAATTGGETFFVSPAASSRTVIVLKVLDFAFIRGASYILDVNIPPKLSLADGQQTQLVEEGDVVTLSAQTDDINDTDILRYSWTQLSGPPLLTKPQTDQDLSITLPNDLIDKDESSKTAVLKLEVSDGLASDDIKASLKILKKNNGSIAALEGAPIWLNAYEVLAPEIDLSKDSDGSGNGNSIAYQWQEMKNGKWQDIDGAILKMYRLPSITLPNSQYRVVVSYTDKQAYSSSVISTATSFVLDIDRDDDGLIEISDLEGLNAMRYRMDGTGYQDSADAQLISAGCPTTPTAGCKGYELVSDLDFDDDASYRDLSNKVRWSKLEGQNGWQPIGTANNPFDSRFEANAYAISNLYINAADSNDVGLFGRTGANARLNGVSLLKVHVLGNNAVGALVGRNSGEITASYARGEVIGSGIRIGGLVGVNRNMISDSYAAGRVAGLNNAGGLVGTNWGLLSSSYSIAEPTLTGDGTDVGGLVGLNAETARIVSSYWDTETSGITRHTGGTGLTTKQLQRPTAPGISLLEPYYRWHLNDWDFGNQRQYPAIKVKGILLPTQRAGLFSIGLEKGSELSPEFDPNHYDYSVTVYADTTQLSLSPIANNPNAFVVINALHFVASGSISPPLLLEATTDTMITLQAKSNRASKENLYKLKVNNRFPEVAINGIPQRATDEGTTVVLDVSTADLDGDKLTYQWEQRSGINMAVNRQGIIRNQNDADLSFRIADDLLDATQTDIDIELLLTISDGKASVVRIVSLKINKHNSYIPDTLSALEQGQSPEPEEELSRYTYISEAPARQGLTYTAPDIDLSLDADGESRTPKLSYQWQRAAGSEWVDIAGETDKTYTIQGEISLQYRVLIAYVDGQGHSHIVVSSPSAFLTRVFADATPMTEPTTIYIQIRVFPEGLLPI